MTDYQMGEVETRFANIIWDNEPISSTSLAKLCEGELGWKKSTTYTVLKRLCGKGIFKNEQGTVGSLITREEFYSAQSEQFVETTFKGSLPAFLTAFSARKGLTREEVEELRRLVREYGEDE
ncbi:MAG: BlaI/MecI/CopY family transcriptional regulator [Clostridia bacterium]|nr:BlaI/MecI/CopY family transcriptional regulator [Clostridia bacterium]